jgi:hypothetical protein
MSISESVSLDEDSVSANLLECTDTGTVWYIFFDYRLLVPQVSDSDPSVRRFVFRTGLLAYIPDRVDLLRSCIKNF